MHLINRPWVLNDKNKNLDIDFRDNTCNKISSKSLRNTSKAYDFLTSLLIAMGYDTIDAQREFLLMSQETSYNLNPFDLFGMDRIAQRLTIAIEKKEKVILHGDYDLDGLSSSALIHRYFYDRGLDLEVFIPSRISDGYGISEASIDFIEAKETDLLLTVDCGITAVDECRYLQEKGITVCITDHHMPGVALPDTNFLIDPQMKENEGRYENLDLAGVGVALKLVQALELIRNKCQYDSPEGKRVIENITYQYADLVCLGTIADLMFMSRENTSLIRLGIEKIKRKDAIIGLQAFLDTKKISNENIDAQTLSIQVCPSFNAAGRISNVYDALNLLLAENVSEAKKYAEKLNVLNDERKIYGNLAYENAQEYICRNPDEVNGKFICFEVKDCHPGVLGIVAAKISEYFALSTLLFTLDPCHNTEEKYAKLNTSPEQVLSDKVFLPMPFSPRTETVSINEELKLKGSNDCEFLTTLTSNPNKHILEDTDKISLRGSARTYSNEQFYNKVLQSSAHLLKFGGHQQAFGAEIYQDKLAEFKEHLISQYEADNGIKDSKHFFKTYDFEITQNNLKLCNAISLNCFEPSGRGKNILIFRCNNLKIKSAKAVGANREHLQLKLSKNKIETIRKTAYSRVEYIDAIAFNMGEMEALCKEGQNIDLLFSMHVNHFMGKDRLQLQVKDIHFNIENEELSRNKILEVEKSTAVQKVACLYNLFLSCCSQEMKRGFYISVNDIKNVFWKLIIPKRINNKISKNQIEILIKILEELDIIKVNNLSSDIKFIILNKNETKPKISESKTYMLFKEELNV